MSRRGGYTLIETLVATLLVAVAVTAVMGGLSSLGGAETRARHADLLQRLAVVKMNETLAAGDPNTIGDGGNFASQGHEEVSWAMEATTSGTTNVDQVTITASLDDQSQSVTCLMYIRPTSGSTTTQ